MTPDAATIPDYDSTVEFVSYISKAKYSCTWMDETQIELEFTTSHRSAWVVSLECPMFGDTWSCYQFIDGLKEEPKVKEVFFRAAYRKYKQLKAA